MTERLSSREIAANAIKEIRETQPFVPSADIDMVWVVTAPGTYSTTPATGIYGDRWPSADRERIDYGIELVQQITALRLGRTNEDPDANNLVTKTEIENHGPCLFYNGEDQYTQNGVYLQNEQLALAASHPSFPIPNNKLIIDRIEKISTPVQVVGLAAFLQKHPEFKKIAVVTHVAHASRVGRYLEYYRELFPDVSFLKAALPENFAEVSIILSEIRKIQKYYALQYLAAAPWAKF